MYYFIYQFQWLHPVCYFKKWLHPMCAIPNFKWLHPMCSISNKFQMHPMCALLDFKWLHPMCALLDNDSSCHRLIIGNYSNWPLNFGHFKNCNMDKKSPKLVIFKLQGQNKSKVETCQRYKLLLQNLTPIKVKLQGRKKSKVETFFKS